jgi:hypothetical protein
MINGNPANKKPKPVIIPTEMATTGDINIAIKIGTWLANVKDAGPIMILGKYIGIKIPIAHNNPAMTMVITLFNCFVILIYLPFLFGEQPC